MNGVLGINKPKGFTSFDVVAKLRGILQIKKIGHAGTLDPMATGVLPILIGKAVKLCDLIPDEYKEYLATFRFGITTDTFDITGKVLSQVDSSVTPESLTTCLVKYMGEFLQKVPAYSAVKVDGRKLYDLARRGEQVKRPSRVVTITKLEIMDYNFEKQEGLLLVGCSKGTYLRSLVSDIGQDLGCGATLTELVRTQSCGIKLEQTFSLNDAEEMMKADQLSRQLIPMERFFCDFDEVRLTCDDTRKFCSGAKLPLLTEPKTELLRIHGLDGSFLGLGRPDSVQKVIKIHKLLI
ncbi:MAG: tRNA pseudouridine(55) synthase TruB [Oscillospiraceae bacterium]|jgi:tRNA pseudouridine55 synthase|nr:tRNA pseudouridine(55) synthase TruB [Oscillospiraceae bacterium]